MSARFRPTIDDDWRKLAAKPRTRQTARSRGWDCLSGKCQCRRRLQKTAAGVQVVLWCEVSLSSQTFAQCDNCIVSSVCTGPPGSRTRPQETAKDHRRDRRRHREDHKRPLQWRVYGGRERGAGGKRPPPSPPPVVRGRRMKRV